MSSPIDATSGDATSGDVCANCGAPLDGPYCSQCGQKDVERVRPLRELGVEAVEELIAWDLRVFRTLKALVLRPPGRLTRAYLAGQRHAYTSPLRLFMGASVLFFLLLSAPSWIGSFSLTPSAETDPVTVTDTTDLAPLEGMVLGLVQGFQSGLEDGGRDGEGSVPDLLNRTRKTNRDLESSYSHLRERASRIGDVLSVLVFLFFPACALVLRVLFRQHVYVAHLVFSLHLYTFGFVVFIAHTLLHYALSSLGRGAETVLLVTAAGAVAAYVLLAIRHVYESSWGRTAVSVAALFLAHSILFLLSAYALILIAVF